MNRPKWTVLLVRRGEASPRRLTGGRLALAAGAVAFLSVLSFVVIAIGVARGAELTRLVQVQHQNVLLEGELGELKERLGAMQVELAALEERDAEIRVLAGLDTIPHEVREAGIGGPGIPAVESHALYSLNEDLGKASFATSYDLGALERRARLLRESLGEAADSLQAHRDLLLATPSILPTQGRLTSSFSSARPHPIHHRALPHEGVDISAPRGTPILAAAKGRVTFAARRSGYGMMVELDHGYGHSTLYAHASELLVRPGQTVERGDVIARVGRSGLATSPHLHYEVRVGGRPMNPMNYVLTGAIP